jgi:hypothetical protein
MKFSKFISYFFHPINFPIIGSILFFLLVPEHIYKQQEHIFITVILIGTYIFPLFLVFVFKRFGIITSLHMESIEERKFPTIMFMAISLILGNWLFRSSIADLLSLFYFGYTLYLVCSYLFLFYNIKLSMHLAAIGGLIGFLIYFSYYYQINLIFILVLLFLISGLIAYSRLRLQAHNSKEILLGYLLGVFTQFVMFTIYYII